MSEDEHYTLNEAIALLGRRFKNTAEYTGIPAGTTGKVTGIYGSDDEHGIDITWEGIEPSSPRDVKRGGLTDGFSKKDMETVFTEGKNKGKPAMVEVGERPPEAEGTNQRVDHIYAVIMVHEPGNEGIASMTNMQGQTMTLVGSSEKSLEHMRELVPAVEQSLDKPCTIYKYTQREEIP